MNTRPFVSPFLLPLAAFAAAIAAGGVLLSLDVCAVDKPVPFVDALFTATSAVCVTGLATVDVSTVFNRTGQGIIMLLMQLGGLGVVTYSTLFLYMISKRISLWDRLAVGQALLHDSSFHLGRFLQRVIVTVLGIEILGAALLYALEPDRIGLFDAAFLAVSGFCNAGFALWPDNLMQWKNHWGVNLVVMGLIILGGLGFYVVDELIRYWRRRLRGPAEKLPPLFKPAVPMPSGVRLSFYSRLVLSTTTGLVFFGALALFLADLNNAAQNGTPLADRVLASLFQSVTSRTAGFATQDMAALSDAALLITIVLMFIGGSPGSCAGGIKTTTFRVLCSYMAAQIRGHRQVTVRGRAMDSNTLNKVMLLFYCSVLTIIVATLLLSVTENGAANHGAAPIQILDIFFEVVSAFATVGLSINLTPLLSEPGKFILCVVMFIGRLGPIWFVATIQQFQSEPAYRYPENDLPIG